MDQAEGQGPVRPRANLQPHVRLVRETDAPRIDDQQLGAARLRRRDVDGEVQEIAIGVRTPHHDASAPRDVRHRQRRHPEGVERPRRVPRPLAKMGRPADVRRAEVVDESLEPALGVGERGAAGGPLVERHRLRAGRRAYLEELPRDQIERLVPAARLPARVGVRLGAGAAQRNVDPVVMVVELRRGPALRADRAPEGMRAVRLDRTHPSVLDRRLRVYDHRVVSIPVHHRRGAP